MSLDSSARHRPRWLLASVVGLVVLIVWTLTIKYLAPLHWFWAERLAGRSPQAVPVMWDAWPLAHLALLILLWNRHRRAWAAGVAISVSEIGVVATKLLFYLRAPDLSFWRLLWFTNKLYVLLLFVCLLGLLLGPGRRDLHRRRPASGQHLARI